MRSYLASSPRSVACELRGGMACGTVCGTAASFRFRALRTGRGKLGRPDTNGRASRHSLDAFFGGHPSLPSVVTHGCCWLGDRLAFRFFRQTFSRPLCLSGSRLGDVCFLASPTKSTDRKREPKEAAVCIERTSPNCHMQGGPKESTYLSIGRRDETVCHWVSFRFGPMESTGWNRTVHGAARRGFRPCS
ncbi:hypothetical protein MPNT_10181 [Candidatus Methylacidithermus pantelleriae]|uniref:Uncharacterized protein n=1 Tax=Candidatus Methylacidithermus pantelleriae TaxID=2744239 RepID=A0A8J2FRL1_9BACT|nr:hypothetical protein MPNT_10181 [Candidatus Methylacidithermus pantelleriae]